jgi:hypothetical protein
VVARASQDRPHFHLPTAHLFETRPRAEHAILLERDTSAPVRIAPRAGGVFRNPEPQRRFETNDAPRASEARSDGEQRPRPLPQGPRPSTPRERPRNDAPPPRNRRPR